MDPFFLDSEDDDYDTITIGETGFQYKVGRCKLKPPPPRG